MKNDVKASPRFESIDILRGFDMIWIMGFPAILWALNAIFGGSILAWFTEQMSHAEWDGLHIMDMVFPTFLFIAGCTFPFSLSKREITRKNACGIHRHVFTRGFLLILLGCVYNGILANGFEDIRIASVLARIGIAWMLGALIFMHTSGKVTRLLTFFGILIGYALLIGLVKAPDAADGDAIYSMQGNLVGWVDRILLPGKLYYGNFDPEGILSTVPAISTALLGMMIGDILYNIRNQSTLQLAKQLLISGLIIVLLGFSSSYIIPINKALWTSSFVLMCGGIDILLLALLFWIVDVKGYKKWGFFFKIIGVNSLVIYLSQVVLNFHDMTNFFLGSISKLFPEVWGNLLLALGYITACWLFLYILYRKKIFVKI